MSQRNSQYARLADDRYITPAWVTEALCDHMHLPMNLWEPAAGNGAISRVLKERGYNVLASDLKGDPEQGIEERNFLLTIWGEVTRRGIISNPPYDHAQKFVEHALSLMQPDRVHGGVVAMLLRVDWDSAKTRAHLFRDCPAWTRKIVLTRRIKWIEDSTGSPSENHAWYVWKWRNKARPTIGYAP